MVLSTKIDFLTNITFYVTILPLHIPTAATAELINKKLFCKEN